MVTQAGAWDTDALAQEPFSGRRRELWVPLRAQRSHKPSPASLSGGTAAEQSLVTIFLGKRKKPKEEAGLGATAYQAWRAQIGSISVTYTMEPMAFKAAQQPLPTWGGSRAQRRGERPRARETPSASAAAGSVQGPRNCGRLFCSPEGPSQTLSATLAADTRLLGARNSWTGSNLGPESGSA